MKLRIKRIGEPSRYVEQSLRDRYAIETFTSITASPAEQCIELELMLLDSVLVDDIPGDDRATTDEE